MTGSKTITCPNCGGSVAIRAAGYTVSVACRYCGALLDVANPDVHLIAQYGEAVAQLALPLGSRGVLFGVEWEVIGWQERQDSSVSWTEFLLFNPYAGYRWLVHVENHWQFGTMLAEAPQIDDDDCVRWRGETWQLADPPETTETTRVLGEFYWRVKAGDQVDAASFVCGSETLSFERNADEVTWTHLVNLRPSGIRSSFRAPPADDAAEPSEAAPAAEEEAFAEPGLLARWADLPWYEDADFPKVVLIAMLSVVLVYVGMDYLGTVSQSVSQQLAVQIDGPAVQTTVGTITVGRATQAVNLYAGTADGTFVNKWVDIDYALVNRATQHAIRADGTLEYYAGRDSDGNWTEGSYRTQVSVSTVPAGTYDVVAQAQGHHWTDPKAAAVATANGWDSVVGDTHTIWFVSQVGGMEWGVFWTVLVLIVIPPAVQIYVRAKRA